MLDGQRAVVTQCKQQIKCYCATLLSFAMDPYAFTCSHSRCTLCPDNVAVVLVPLSSQRLLIRAHVLPNTRSEGNRRLFSFTSFLLANQAIDRRIDDELLNVPSAKIKLGKCDPGGATTEGLRLSGC